MINWKSLIGFVSGIISIPILFISIYSVMLLNPIYDFRIHMISLLGIIKGKYFFNIGIIIVGTLHIPFINSLRIYLKKKNLNKNLITSAFIFGLIFCFAEIGVGIFPANIKYGFNHSKVAFLFFNSALFMTFLFSMLLLQNIETKQLGFLSLTSFLLTFLFMYVRSSFLEWIMAIGVWSFIGVVSCCMIYRIIRGIE